MKSIRMVEKINNGIHGFRSLRSKKLRFAFTEEYGEHTINSFQRVVSPILIVAQFFGILPVIYMTDKSGSRLKFKWIALRTILAVSVLIGICYEAVKFFYLAILVGSFGHFTAGIFHICSAGGIMYFIILAKKWPELMTKWRDAEKIIPNRNYKTKQKMAYHIRFYIIILAIFGVTEHTLLIVVSFKTVMRPKQSFHSLTENFFKLRFFMLSSFTICEGLMSQLSNIASTVVWHYTSLIVIVFSIGLTSLFRQLNQDMQGMNGQFTSEKYWKLRRSQYRALSHLCSEVDDGICQITAITVASNVFLICIQIFQSTRPLTSTMQAVYFWFSLLFIAIRTLIVLSLAASVNEESKKPINVLRSIPTYSWCTEAERFLEEVVNNNIALSGMGFFYLTRSLMLNVVGTIVTYELILMQLQSGKSFYEELSGQ